MALLGNFEERLFLRRKRTVDERIVVANEIRERAASFRRFEPRFVLLRPRLELVGQIVHRVLAPLRGFFALKNALRVRVELLLRLQYRRGVTTAMRMPARELKRLRIFPLQIVANVVKAMRLAVRPETRVVLRKLDLHPHDEIKILHSQMVGRTIGDVYLRRRQTPRVLVGRTIDTAPGVIGRRALRKVQNAVLIAYTTKQRRRVLKIAAERAAHLNGRNAVAQTEIQPHFHFLLELLRQVPHTLRKIEPTFAAREKGFARTGIRGEVSAARRTVEMLHRRAEN